MSVAEAPNTVIRRGRGLVRTVANKLFRFTERRLGFHITPVHYYSPIPDVGRLPKKVFDEVNDCCGLEFHRIEQQKILEDLVPKYLEEFLPQANSGLSQVDAFILYSMIRLKKPKVFIEIGSGESTKVSLLSLTRNRTNGIDSSFVAIEPFPRDYLREIGEKGFRLIESNVQDVPLSTFADADILFIDSSHVSKIGSDVNYEILNIIPRLKVGALVHWHDIMIPADYPRAWIESGRMFWNESYVVHAFMLYNKSFRIIWASRYMQLYDAARLARMFPYFKPEDPDQQLSSFWIERVG
ncbi:MAG: class I SAM-dependent methyltransferase [Gemmatimonadota bacterium]|nr:class I SAM-dependent methyltransferase [Gemmatimonadota bacterium]